MPAVCIRSALEAAWLGPLAGRAPVWIDDPRAMGSTRG
jgi:hypothetical protein